MWRADNLKHVAWLEWHDAAANAAIMIAPQGVVSVGDDFHVRSGSILGEAAGETVGRHQGKVMDVAVQPGGTGLIATAGWDGAVGLWRLAAPDPGIGPALERTDTDDADPFLKGHRGAVNAVAFSRDGERLYSASADGTVRVWRLSDRQQIRVEARHGFGVNKLIVGPDDAWLAYGATDGVVRVMDPSTGKELATFGGERRPILAMALSPGGEKLAYGDGQGYISVISVADWTLDRDFKAATRGPIWALAFRNNDTLLAGGLDDDVAVWPIEAPELPKLPPASQRRFQVDPTQVSNGERQFARKCSVCHTLTPDGKRRAGPTLHGVFGRRAGTLAGYTYSDALEGSQIVWSPATLDKLFDLGPDHYTPGSKMPMQRIAKQSDRDDLIAYLKEVTVRSGPPTATATGD